MTNNDIRRVGNSLTYTEAPVSNYQKKISLPTKRASVPIPPPPKQQSHTHLHTHPLTSPPPPPQKPPPHSPKETLPPPLPPHTIHFPSHNPRHTLPHPSPSRRQTLPKNPLMNHTTCPTCIGRVTIIRTGIRPQLWNRSIVPSAWRQWWWRRRRSRLKRNGWMYRRHGNDFPRPR